MFIVQENKQRHGIYHQIACIYDLKTENARPIAWCSVYHFTVYHFTTGFSPLHHHAPLHLTSSLDSVHILEGYSVHAGRPVHWVARCYSPPRSCSLNVWDKWTLLAIIKSLMCIIMTLQCILTALMVARVKGWSNRLIRWSQRSNS